MKGGLWYSRTTRTLLVSLALAFVIDPMATRPAFAGPPSFLDLAASHHRIGATSSRTSRQVLDLGREEESRKHAASRGKKVLVERYKYLAFGKEEIQNPDGTTRGNSVIGNPHRFQGRWRDAAEGSPLTYFRNRYYHTGQGRFTTRDPIGVWGDSSELGGSHSFCGNNTQRGGDPFGLAGLPTWNDVKTYVKDSPRLSFLAGEAVGLGKFAFQSWETASGQAFLPWLKDFAVASSRAFFHNDLHALDDVMARAKTGLCQTVVGIIELGSIPGELDILDQIIETGVTKGTFAAGEMFGERVLGPLAMTLATWVDCYFNCFVAGTLVSTPDGEKPIEDVHVGDRVRSTSADGQPPLEIDESRWRKVELTFTSAEGPIHAVVIRPVEWLKATGCVEGADIDLSLSEIGTARGAHVVKIFECPRIAAGKGEVVLSTFTSMSSSVVEVRFAGSGEVLAGTSAHSVFSETRHAWVRLGDLMRDEKVRRDGGRATIAAVKRLAGHTRVFNLEVSRTHTFFVSSLHLVAHNTCFDESELPGGLGGEELPHDLALRERGNFEITERNIANNEAGIDWEVELHRRLELDPRVTDIRVKPRITVTDPTTGRTYTRIPDFQVELTSGRTVNIDAKAGGAVRSARQVRADRLIQQQTGIRTREMRPR